MIFQNIGVDALLYSYTATNLNSKVRDGAFVICGDNGLQYNSVISYTEQIVPSTETKYIASQRAIIQHLHSTAFLYKRLWSANDVSQVSQQEVDDFVKEKLFETT